MTGQFAIRNFFIAEKSFVCVRHKGAINTKMTIV